MKCIKAIKETKAYSLGEIRRTDDVDADQKVASGVWVFIPKVEWKKWKNNNREVSSEIVVRDEKEIKKKTKK